MKHLCPNCGYPRTPRRVGPCPECGQGYHGACHVAATRRLRRGLALGLGLCALWPLWVLLIAFWKTTGEAQTLALFYIPAIVFVSFLTSAFGVLSVSRQDLRLRTLLVASLIAIGTAGVALGPAELAGDALFLIDPFGFVALGTAVVLPLLCAIVAALWATRYYARKISTPSPLPDNP